MPERLDSGNAASSGRASALAVCAATGVIVDIPGSGASVAPAAIPAPPSSPRRVKVGWEGTAGDAGPSSVEMGERSAIKSSCCVH